MNHPHPNLSTPPALVDGGLRIVALGGLTEIGRNMTVFEYKSKLLIVDCGVLFPEENQPGIDLILPDFSYIRDRLQDVVGIFLTHGHEDHIGAVPYLLRERGDIALYGSALTLALITAKLNTGCSVVVPDLVLSVSTNEPAATAVTSISYLSVPLF